MRIYLVVSGRYSDVWLQGSFLERSIAEEFCTINNAELSNFDGLTVGETLDAYRIVECPIIKSATEEVEWFDGQLG